MIKYRNSISQALYDPNYQLMISVLVDFHFKKIERTKKIFFNISENYKGLHKNDGNNKTTEILDERGNLLVAYSTLSDIDKLNYSLMKGYI